MFLIFKKIRRLHQSGISSDRGWQGIATASVAILQMGDAFNFRFRSKYPPQLTDVQSARLISAFRTSLFIGRSAGAGDVWSLVPS